VGEELGRYLTAGCRAIILDVPPDQGELGHVRLSIEAAERALLNR
jgi:hypothetical protein